MKNQIITSPIKVHPVVGNYKVADKNKVTYVDYYGSMFFFLINNIQTNGTMSFCISAIDSKDKESRGYASCTGVLVTGVSKSTGKNISFLTHQNVNNFYLEGESLFIRSLKNRLEKMRIFSKEGTLHAVIFGGWNFGQYIPDYRRSIEQLQSVIDYSCSIPAPVVSPKLTRSTDSVYFENDTLNLFIKRE